MIVRNWHIDKVASLRDAREVLVITHRTAPRLYGVINIKSPRGFYKTNADSLFCHNSQISILKSQFSNLNSKFSEVSLWQMRMK